MKFAINFENRFYEDNLNRLSFDVTVLIFEKGNFRKMNLKKKLLNKNEFNSFDSIFLRET